jgi:hypothetical protein
MTNMINHSLIYTVFLCVPCILTFINVITQLFQMKHATFESVEDSPMGTEVGIPQMQPAWQKTPSAGAGTSLLPWA